jgi:hypothetical protein
MPSGKEGEKPAAKAKKAPAEEEAKQKAAHQHALHVKKQHRMLKPKAFSKKFDEEILKVRPAVAHAGAACAHDEPNGH